MYPTRQCIANRQGDVSIVSISRAITIGTPQEDVALSKFTSYKHLHSKIMLFLKLKLMLLLVILYLPAALSECPSNGWSERLWAGAEFVTGS